MILVFLLFIEFFSYSDALCAEFPGSKCIAIDECKPIYDKLQNLPHPLPKSHSDEFRALGCGFDDKNPLVCCAGVTKTTPLTSFGADPTGHQPVVTKPVIVSNRNAPSNRTDDHPNLNLVNSDTCGAIVYDKLSGGNSTVLKQFPWMVLLEYDTISGTIFGCGGSLINERYVLTAAHCITRLFSGRKLISVRLGEHNIKTDVDCETIDTETVCTPPVQNIPVEETVFHENYNQPRFSNDIALIRLVKAADMSPESVRPICLPTTKMARATILKRLTVTGWGTTENGQLSDVLLQINVPIVPNEQCQGIHRSITLSDGQMCAGGEVGIDSCQGDSGGPIAQPGTIADYVVKYIQFGIVSAGGRECSLRTNTPGIYTNVSFYMSWILDNLRN